MVKWMIAAGLAVLGALGALLPVIVLRAAPAEAAAGSDRLFPGEILYPDQAIASATSVLIMQSDGNLVEYGPNWAVYWASWTQGNPGSVAVLQGDGNFVIYAPGNVPIWSTGTWGNYGAELILQPQSDRMIVRSYGTIVWSNGVKRCNVYPSGVPSQQESFNADSSMSGERSAWWNNYPDGTSAVVTSMFIAAGDVSLNGSLAQDALSWVGWVANWVLFPGFLGDVQIKGVGDGRGFTPWFNPADARAYSVLDIQDGYGFLYSNHSTLRVNWVFPWYTQTVYNQSFDALQPVAAYNGSSDSWVHSDWVNSSDLRLRVSLRNSVPGSSWIGYKIDQQFALRSYDLGWPHAQGDRYPSVEVYRYSDCSLAGWGPEGGFTKAEENIDYLADSISWTYNWAVNGYPW
jgi:hypothetical protein